jgi:hypothetical protein
MSVAARELQAEVLSILSGTGCKVLNKGLDGAGHQKITFLVNEHERTFHYPHTMHLNGRNRRNVAARLRRLIREAPPAPTPAPAPAPDQYKTTSLPAAKPPRVTAARRREIAKRYLKVRSLDVLMEETGLERHKLHILLNSAGGEPQRMFRRDLNKAAAERAKTIREARQPTAPIIMKKAAAKPKPAPKAPRPYMRGPAALKRNIKIATLIYRKKMPVEEVAKRFEMAVTYVAKIAQDHFPLIGKKVA